MVGAASLLLLSMATAFGTAPTTVIYTGHFNAELEQIGSPLPQRVDTDAIFTREVRIRQGDTVAALLAGLGVHDDQSLAFLSRSRETAELFRQLVPGRILTARVSADGALHSLAFPLHGKADSALLVERTDAGLTARVERMEIETEVILQTAVINHSLFGAADEAGIPDGIATQLADIFGGDLDFHRDLRKGDRFSVIYEQANHQGRPLRTQRVLAAEFINDGRAYRAFWYQGRDGTAGYYSADGSSVKKAFLRSPLEFSRISSGFSRSRFHPILRELRAHRGIDYAAPIGTRVRATGDGVVEFAGTQGGYGKVVMIRHGGDKTTVYGHLSGFAPALRKGVRVQQGEIIAYVGATGLASGPHLHYEFRIAGVHRNPLTVVLPPAAPLAESQMPAFRAHADAQIARITDMSHTRAILLD